MLENKVVLITGCNRGIGKALLEKFAENRAIIYAIAKQEGSLEENISSLNNKYKLDITPVYFNLIDDSMIKKTIYDINRNHKRLDILVNNAGVMKDALIGMVTAENMKQTFEVNVFAMINCIQYATKIMKRNKTGSIINITSIVGKEGNPGQIIYSASKGAVIALTKTASKELAQYNIRVNAIAPGMIDTDMFNSIGAAKISQMISKIGFGRLGAPEEIAELAAFLGSDSSRYITGQIIGVDGGAII
jgi:3-oxoacyl-[acyl-carrier protein] reductase